MRESARNYYSALMLLHRKNVAKVARAAGVNRSELYAKLKALGLWPRSLITQPLTNRTHRMER